jgi:hypothetical protein
VLVELAGLRGRPGRGLVQEAPRTLPVAKSSNHPNNTSCLELALP